MINKNNDIKTYCIIPTPIMLVLFLQLTNLLAIATIIIIFYSIYHLVQKKMKKRSFSIETTKIIKLFIPISVIYFMIIFLPFDNNPFYTNDQYFFGYLLLSFFFWAFTYMIKKINNQPLFHILLAFAIILSLASITVTIAKLIPQSPNSISCEKPPIF